MKTDEQIAIVLLQGKKLTSDGNKKKTEWTEIEQSEYPFYFSADLKWEHGKRFRVIPHMKARNDEKLTFALKQFKDATKKINSVSDKNRDYYEKIEKGEAIYYRPPYKKTNGQERSNWYVSIGSETIIVTFDDGTIENMTVVSETIHPEHEDYCKKLIEDLVAIDQKLCIDEKKKSSIDVYKNTWIKDTIDSFCKLFDCIEASPASDLKSDYRKVPKDKVKRYSPKNIIQIATNQPKVDSIVLEESIDIYEHRLIKYYANKLEKYIDIQKRNLKTKQSSIEKKLETLTEPNDDWDNVVNDDLQFKEKEVKELRKNITELEEKIDCLNNSTKKISKRNETEFFKKVSDTKVGLHMTNLFRYSPNYRKMYRFISDKSIQERLESVDLIDLGGQEISVDKIESIYEHWGLIKILSEFMLKYEFELSGYKYKDTETLVAGSNGREGLRKCIKEIIKDKTNNLSGSEFVFVNEDLNLKIVVNYEEEIEVYNHKLPLRPDYVISIEKIGEDSSKRYFILDAKYRYKIDNYDGFNDLSEVAFHKYTLDLKNSSYFKDKPLWGSFILHNAELCNKPEIKEKSVGEKTYIFKYDPKLYLGTSPNIFFQDWKERGKISEEDWVERFEEWCENVQSENKLGILKVSPAPDGDNFPYLIQMIMEKYFYYESTDRCWLCGNKLTNEQTEPGETHGKNPTRTYRCDACGAFWKQSNCGCKNCDNKLIKHRVNYYPHEKNNLFYVLCPCWRKDENDPYWDYLFNNSGYITPKEKSSYSSPSIPEELPKFPPIPDDIMDEELPFS